VLDLTWSGYSECCGSGDFTGGGFGGSVWNLETGTPVLIYSWSAPLSQANRGGTNVTLPIDLGVHFSVAVWASASDFISLTSAATVSIHPIPVPEPGTFVLTLAALAAAGVLKTRRTRRT
jgi:hypothetical protein